jgi:hypothetical protein
MNSKTRRSKVITYLNQALEKDRAISAHPAWNKRFGEIIAPAGFGHASPFDFHRNEQCVGQYIPDETAIRERIIERGFSPELTRRFVQHFTDALFSIAHDCRADLVDDLHGPFEMLSHQRVNELQMRQWIDYSLDDEELHSRKIFSRYILDDNPEPNLFTYEYQLPAGFPARSHLNKSLSIPIIARYDLDGGEDPYAAARNQNRQLALEGTMILKPSGPRGWTYPTIRYEEAPFRDDRNQHERTLQPNPRPGKDYDSDQFDDGLDAAREKIATPPVWEMSESWWAGFIMLGGDCIAHAHMGTGRVDAAFYEALGRAEALRVPNAAALAANACRHLASTRCARALEDVIREYLDSTQVEDSFGGFGRDEEFD